MRSPKSPAKIQAVVEELLRRHNIGKVPVPVEDIARKEGAELRYLPYDGDLSGMVFRDDDRVVIGVNSFHPQNRQRFTIAHEIGHMLLHKGKEIFVDKEYLVNRRDDVSAQAVDPEEIEANRFAAALLMPQATLESDLANRPIDMENEEDLRKLAKRYGVSLTALIFRINNLMKIS